MRYGTKVANSEMNTYVCDEIILAASLPQCKRKKGLEMQNKWVMTLIMSAMPTPKKVKLRYTAAFLRQVFIYTDRLFDNDI